MRKRFVLSVALLLVYVFIASAQQYSPESDFEFKVIQGGREIEITGYKGISPEVRIPPRINNIPVTIITEDAFNRKRLTSVTIPNSVYEIEKSAFENNLLTAIIIPNSVEKIGARAFAQNRIASLIIPQNLTDIGAEAFRSNQLTEINIPNSLRELGNGAFSRNQISSITFGNRVNRIGANVFAENKLTSLTIPPHITSIGNGTFSGNPLSSVTIGANVDVAYGRPTSFASNVRRSDSFIHDFSDFYVDSGKKAGTYTCTVTFTPDPQIERLRAMGMTVETDGSEGTISGVWSLNE